MDAAPIYSLLALLEIETGLLIILAGFSIYKSLKLSQMLRDMVMLKKNYEEQIKVQKERDDFLAMLVHELRSPLAVMKGSSDLILKDAHRLDQNQIETLLTQIRTSSNGMLKIVSDILDVSKIDAGKFEIQKTFGNFNKTIKDESDYYKPLASEKQLTIEVRLDETAPSFNFDPDRVRQIVNNLLSNAIKYSNEGGQVLVTSKKVQNLVEVAVIDTGEGVSDDLKIKLFHKFVQLNNHLHSKQDGTGLGLVIAKGIVEAHGGKIWVEDNKPKGAKFIFSIPIS